jgi:hypothetical protein
LVRAVIPCKSQAKPSPNPEHEQKYVKFKFKFVNRGVTSSIQSINKDGL